MYLLVGVVSVAIGPGGAVDRLNVFSIHLICREWDHVRCGVDSTVVLMSPSSMTRATISSNPSNVIFCQV